MEENKNANNIEEKTAVKAAEAEEAKKETGEKGGESKQKKNATEKKAKANEPRGRRRLFADYRYKEVKNKKGKTVRRKVYTGKYYGFMIPGSYKKNEKEFINRIKLTFSLCYLAISALWVLSGVAIHPLGLGAGQSTGFSGQHFYVLFPYIMCALPIFLMFLTIVEFIFTKGNRHEKAFAEALKQNLKWQTVMEMICALLCLICEAVFIVINYNEITDFIYEFTLIIFMAAIVAVSLFWLKMQDGLPMEVKK